MSQADKVPCFLFMAVLMLEKVKILFPYSYSDAYWCVTNSVFSSFDTSQEWEYNNINPVHVDENHKLILAQKAGET